MSFERPIYPTNGLRFLNNPEYPSYPVEPPTAQPTHYTDRQHQPQSISSPSWVQPITRAKLPLRINIVGAGLGGLATAIALTLSGHSVKLFEQAPAFGEVGAGIQVPPNSTRYLLAWGVGPHIEPHISEPEGIRIRRWQSGEVIGMTALRSGHDTPSSTSKSGEPGFRQKFGAPYFVVHRADYHAALVARCKELNVDIHEGCEVVAFEFADREPAKESVHTRERIHEQASAPTSPGSSCTLVLKNGSRHPADLIIAADGLKSPARAAILRSHNLEPVAPHSTAQAAYRATVPLAELQTHPATTWITATANQNLWIGPTRHAMTYSIGGPRSPSRVFNLVLSHPEPRPPEQWSTEAAQVRRDMKAHFAGWDARFLAVLDCVAGSERGRVVKWPITTVPALPTWVHASRRMVLLGDAAHAMVPYMSQGAAVAVEDAAAVAALLALVETREEVGEALLCFERVRMPRATGMQQAGRLNGEIWHLEDGELQRARDQAMKWSVEMELEETEETGQGTSVNGRDVDGQSRQWNPNQWSDPVCQAWTYGYDAAGEANIAWEERKSGRK